MKHLLALGLATAAVHPVAVRQESEPSSTSKEPAAQRRVAAFADGVTIDWRFPLVELEARVVLRAGPLELLACSPRTREHESILQIPARPLHIFQACGLIGLQPGAPVNYDAANDRWIAPTGQPLTLRVLGSFEFGEVTVPVEAWMTSLKEPGREIRTIPWVFAGSRVVEGGAFGADEDGTIVCVVDFSTALITIGELHSADDELLWLGADPRYVPKEGARCKLLVSPRIDDPLLLHVLADGGLRIADKAVTAPDAAARWRRASESAPTGPSDPVAKPTLTPDAPNSANPAGAPPQHDVNTPPREKTESPWRVIELRPQGRVASAVMRGVSAALAAEGVPPAAMLVDPRSLPDARQPPRGEPQGKPG
ncbi:MAG: hypothetical protein FLDDKLPJ_01233 [Phycisphaerae bacterium]|nr:hypothetical protein [Phycisphaerae bacterium]